MSMNRAMTEAAAVEPHGLRVSLAALRCPECHGALASAGGDGAALSCSDCEAAFPVNAGRPILLRRDNELFSASDYLDARAASESGHRAFPGISLNLCRERILREMRQALDGRGPSRILVVGGGRQRPHLTPLMCQSAPHELTYCDVDSSADVDLFCDAHTLPFKDGSFDAVITTAVLEHVMYPEKAAAEIARVLGTGGLLYSEMPFMQQVHEGAYDFTRYTLSGHRRLFRHFAERNSGLVAGPATALSWAIENFVLAFFSGRRLRLAAKALVRLSIFWIKYFDYLVANRPQAMDGASGTYLLGEKSAVPVSDRQIIERYVGAKHIHHV